MVSLNAQRKRCASVQAVDAYLEALTYARRYALFTLVGEPFLSGDPICRQMLSTMPAAA